MSNYCYRSSRTVTSTLARYQAELESLAKDENPLEKRYLEVAKDVDQFLSRLSPFKYLDNKFAINSINQRLHEQKQRFSTVKKGDSLGKPVQDSLPIQKSEALTESLDMRDDESVSFWKKVGFGVLIALLVITPFALMYSSTIGASQHGEQQASFNENCQDCEEISSILPNSITEVEESRSLQMPVPPPIEMEKVTDEFSTGMNENVFEDREPEQSAGKEEPPEASLEFVEELIFLDDLIEESDSNEQKAEQLIGLEEMIQAEGPVPQNSLPPSSICVLTSYTSDNKERLAMSQLVANDQRKYASERGYHYLEYPENMAKGNEPYWSKIASINHILNNKEQSLSSLPKWIVWLDDDAVVQDHGVKIEDVIRHYEEENPELKVIITEDAMSHVLPHIPLNTGVMFIKNDEWSKEFFQKAWETRNEQVPGERYTYANCPAQSCLHEQQVITELRKREGLDRQVMIIPQRDKWAINTFCRENHYDVKRNMHLRYNADKFSARCREGDFISQCTGLATSGISEWGDSSSPENLRLKCIQQVLKTD